MHHRTTRLVALFSLMLLFATTAQTHALPTVLFDQGHGQKFVMDKDGDLHLSRLAGLFRDAGFSVTAAGAPFTAELLAGANVLILAGTFRPYTTEEIDAITTFVARGGSLCIMLHIASPLVPLLDRFGVVTSGSAIHEQEGVINGNPLAFRVTRLSDHPLFQGIQQFTLYSGWALLDDHPEVRVIARTSPGAWIDLNGNRRADPEDAQQSFAVAVAGRSGSGRFVVFGDDGIFQNRVLVGDNLALGRNLAAWLAAGATQSAP
ncbi:MAG: hypothetical protein FD174_755 [Geobacteraceae bacterium]|nr:MAG: hypothetical protein FD174_755 [Geobacteraceae bacterium]